jgi:hypothetical protein
MKQKTVLLAALGLVLLAGTARAEVAFQFAIPNVNLPESSAVSGLRLSFLHGKNASQRGLDLGLLSVSETQTFSGLALIGGISRVTGNMDGGAAFSLVNWHSGSDSGLNAAFINLVNDTRDGFNLAFVTIADSSTGVDLGGFNLSKASTAQIGFVNVTDRIDSFQLGFLNVAENGFLPIFPFFNFPAN